MSVNKISTLVFQRNEDNTYMVIHRNMKNIKEYKEKIRNFYISIFREIFSDYGFNV